MYKLYIKEPSDIKGIKVGEYSLIEDVRSDMKDLLEGLPDGTQAYVYRQSSELDEEGNIVYWGEIRPAEAYQIENGQIKTIWTRHKGGDWPFVWHPLWYIDEFGGEGEGADYPWVPNKTGWSHEFENEEERNRARRLLEKMGCTSRESFRALLEKPEDYWKENKKAFLERGPRTYPLQGEGKNP